MSERSKMRQERIQRLLDELKYEVTRGIMEREIDETIGFRFIIPISHVIKGGVVCCEFRTRPATSLDALMWGPHEPPRLKIVGGTDDTV